MNKRIQASTNILRPDYYSNEDKPEICNWTTSLLPGKKQILFVKEWLEPRRNVVGIFCKFWSQVKVVCCHEAL